MQYLLFVLFRYFAICKPLSFAMLGQRARTVTYVLLGVSMALMIPAVFLYGVRTAPLNHGKFGCSCYIKDGEEFSIWHILFRVYQFLLNFALFVIISVSYLLVYRTVHQRIKAPSTPRLQSPSILEHKRVQQLRGGGSPKGKVCPMAGKVPAIKVEPGSIKRRPSLSSVSSVELNMHMREVAQREKKRHQVEKIDPADRANNSPGARRAADVLNWCLKCKRKQYRRESVVPMIQEAVRAESSSSSERKEPSENNLPALMNPMKQLSVNSAPSLTHSHLSVGSVSDQEPGQSFLSVRSAPALVQKHLSADPVCRLSDTCLLTSVENHILFPEKTELVSRKRSPVRDTGEHTLCAAAAGDTDHLENRTKTQENNLVSPESGHLDHQRNISGVSPNKRNAFTSKNKLEHGSLAPNHVKRIKNRYNLTIPIVAERHAVYQAGMKVGKMRKITLPVRPFSPSSRPQNSPDEATAYLSEAAINQYQRTRYKTAKILLTVTVVFLVTWFPFWAMYLENFLHPDFWDKMSYAEQNVMRILRYLYMLNHAVNPVIYTFTNKQFREDLKMVFSKLSCSKR